MGRGYLLVDTGSWHVARETGHLGWARWHVGSLVRCHVPREDVTSEKEWRTGWLRGGSLEQGRLRQTVRAGDRACHVGVIPGHVQVPVRKLRRPSGRFLPWTGCRGPRAR